MRSQEAAYLGVMTCATVLSGVLLWLSRATGIGYRRRRLDYKAFRAETRRKEDELDERLRQILRDNRRLMS